MRIIVHGNKYEIGELTCPKCECTFAYNKQDIEIMHIKEYDTYDRDEYDQKTVKCPECNYIIKI